MTPREFAIDIARKLQQAGFQALWAGGCVRDDLLGIEPKDYDVATNARPEQIRELFGYRRTLAIGAAFGVITVLGPRTAGQVEVATFRCDGGYSDGRHPDSVTFSNAEEDALRRDFTINGMFFDPIENQVIDYVGGQIDLHNQLLRAIGEPQHRIDEDKLRMLRAVRFAARFGFAIEDHTLTAIRNHAEEISVVSPERIAGELQRMLTHPHRRRAVALMNETGLLPVILPESVGLIDAPDQFQELLQVMDHLSEFEFAIGLAALLDPLVAKDSNRVVAICRRWRLSNDVTETTRWIVANLDDLHQSDRRPWPLIQRILIDPRIQLAMDLVRAQREVRGCKAGPLKFLRERLGWPADQLNPAALLTGDDLVLAGLTPGKRFSVVLRGVRDAQLEGEIRTKSEALTLAMSIYENCEI